MPEVNAVYRASIPTRPIPDWCIMRPMFTAGRDQPDAMDLESLGETLTALADRTVQEGPWRSGAFAALANFGVLAGFVPDDCGGTGASEPALVFALVAIAGWRRSTKA